MGYINQPFQLKPYFDDMLARIRKLETAQRFTVPIVTTDPTQPRNGDMWFNSTSSTLKFVNSAGTIKTITLT
jgi:hypothetical protein